MLDITVILAGTLVFVFIWKLAYPNRSQRLLDKIPGPRAYPIIGNFLDVICTTDKIIPNALERKKKYGGMVRLWLGAQPLVSITTSEYFEVILSSTQELTKSPVYNFMGEWLGLGLLTSRGSRWFKHRKMITPTFHFKILDSFIPVFESNVEVLVQKLKTASGEKKSVDLHPFITKAALDIICETAMGINLHAQENDESDYIKSVYRLSRLISDRNMRFYYHNNFIYNLTSEGKESKKHIKTLTDYSTKVIKERRALLKTGNENSTSEDDSGVKKRKAFLDLLLDQGELTDTDIREEVDTFMFEGHDTTTAGISWALYLLGHNQDIQEKVAQEVLQAWPKGEPLTMQSLNEMKFLERVLKESQRIYPSVAFIERTLDNDLQMGKYLVPRGTTINMMIACLHMDEETFPNPTKFDPDRFLPEKAQNRNPYAYVPFSAGQRNCIGQKFAVMEEKTAVAGVIREFKVKSLEKREDLVLLSELISRPKNGIQVQLEPRE